MHMQGKLFVFLLKTTGCRAQGIEHTETCKRRVVNILLYKYIYLYIYICEITAKAALKFGSEAWVLKKREEQLLETAQMKFLRHLLGITKLGK